MYTQPPPPSSQQSTQRPISNVSNVPQQQLPSTSNSASSSIQQGWRPVGINNAQAIRPTPPNVQNNNRPPTFPPSQRPPQNATAPGFSRPPIPGLFFFRFDRAYEKIFFPRYNYN